MSNSTDAILQEAFELIEKNELEQARDILTSLLDTDSNNPAVWWVYAHAIEDPDEGRQALNKVVQLDPSYPGANELLTQDSPVGTPMGKPSNIPADEWDDLAFDPAGQDGEAAITGNGGSPIRFLMIAAIVVIIVIGIFGVLSGVFGGSAAQPTAVAGQSGTEIPTLDTQIITNVSATETEVDEPTNEPTEVAPTDEPTEDVSTETPPDLDPTQELTEVDPSEEPTEDTATEIPTIEPTGEEDDTMSIFVAELSDYDIAESDIETRTTLLGETFHITVCAMLGAESSLALNGVMDVLVDQLDNIPVGADAVAVSILDCANEDAVPRTIGVERTHIEALANNEMEIKDFQRQWQPLP